VETDTVYLYESGTEPSDTATIRIKRTYKLDSIYGRTDLPMTLQVREVGEYLYSQDTMYFSNPALRNRDQIDILPNILGTVQVSNKVTTTQVKQKNETTIQAPAVAFTVKLDKDYFKQKFIDNGGANLNDQASF